MTEVIRAREPARAPWPARSRRAKGSVASMSRYLVACDAGGTMTDVIVVDERRRSVIGKAPTTRHDESVGYMESLEEALRWLGLDPARGLRPFCGQVETAIYTGTSM